MIVNRGKLLGTLVSLMFMVLGLGVGNGIAMPIQSERLTCTVYKPTEIVIDDPLDARLVDGVNILEDPKGALEDAITAFNEVIDNADLDDPRMPIARNNLLCAYLKQASIRSQSVIVPTPDPAGNSPSSSACDSLENANRIKAEIQPYLIFASKKVPNIPKCGITLDVSVDVEEVLYPINVSFLLKNQVYQAQVDNTDIYAAWPPRSLSLEGSNPITVPLPIEDVYCYKFKQVNQVPYSEADWQGVHLEDGDVYVTVKDSDEWRLQENTGKYELIIADVLQGSEAAKEIHITTRDNEERSYELVLDNRINREDSVEIEVDPGQTLEITTKEVVTSTADRTSEYEGQDTLYTIDPGQIYTVQEPFDRSSTPLLVTGMSCTTFLDTLKQKEDFGINTLEYENPVEGEVTSLSGNWWKFSGNEGDSVVLEMNSGEMATHVDVYTYSGQLLYPTSDTNDSYDSQVYLDLPETGEYIVAAKGYNGGFGHYTLEVQKDAGCQAESMGMNSIEYGSSDTGYTELDYPEQWVFCGHKGDYVYVSMRSTQLDSYLQLYDSADAYSLLAENDDVSPDACLSYSYIYGDCDAAIQFGPLPNTGMYTIKAASVAGGGAYSLYLERYN